MDEFIWIAGGRVIDPANNRDALGEVFVKNGKIVDNLTVEEREQAHHIDAEGKIVCPGFVDIHVHLREPGQTHKETIKTGTQSAAAGGITTVVAMPNTQPALDTVQTLNELNAIIKRDACINVFNTACFTKDRKGKELSPIEDLISTGIVALTDDGDCVEDNALMRQICEIAAKHSIPLMDHCQEPTLTRGAVMNEGKWSRELGVTGWPNAAEDIIVARNIVLSKYTGAHIHMQHISSAYSVELIREAKKLGIKVTGEAMPHHMALTDECLKDRNANFKMNPPLRTEEDRLAVIEGVLDGTLDIIATDHAPHAKEEKETTLDKAAFGIIGLETLLPICLEVLVNSGKCDLPFLISRITHKPAELLGLKKGTLSLGSDADITVFDPNKEWTLTEESILSKSKNSPWLGKKLKGKATHTLVAGKLIYKA